MADKPRKTEQPKTDAEKKQAETVHLTPEELRKISGGMIPAPPTGITSGGSGSAKTPS
jgi:hypothetical protein